MALILKKTNPLIRGKKTGLKKTNSRDIKTK